MRCQLSRGVRVSLPRALPKIEAALCALRNFPVIIMRAVGFCCAFESLRAPDARRRALFCVWSDLPTMCALDFRVFVCLCGAYVPYAFFAQKSSEQFLAQQQPAAQLNNTHSGRHDVRV